MAIFCPQQCAEAEFANGLCSAHYAEWIARLARAGPTERRELEAMHVRRWAEMRSREHDGRSVARLKRGGVPDALIPPLRAMQPTPATANAQALARREIMLLLMLGRPGTGKSLALACACAEVARTWPWGALPGGSRPVEPFLFIHATAFDGLDGLDGRDAWVSAKLLVIDEMGREGSAAVQRMVDVVIQRHAAGRPTGMASNLVAASWKARYGESLADRVRADGRAMMLASDSMRSEK